MFFPVELPGLPHSLSGPIVLDLNQRAAYLCEAIAKEAELLRVACQWLDCGTEVWDFGIEQPGGLEAGRRLAEVCLAGLADVTFTPADKELWQGPAVQVRTDHPVVACMASQYAGWELSAEGYFAMGSGPMRAVSAHEPLFTEIDFRETNGVCIGVLESSKIPPAAVAHEISEKCGIDPSGIKLLVAPTASQAGNVQVVARSVETALHKLHELGFNLGRIESGWGTALLPPVAADNLVGIGRTNDAVLYGGHAVLYVRGDDDSLRDIGPKIPSNSSSDHGRPFAKIFASYDHDFYKVDKQLFSPAIVTFVNLDSGKTFRFGEYLPDVVKQSFVG